MNTERPWAYSAFPVEVRARRQLSAGFIRLTFGGDALEHFAPWGTDQRIKLVLPMEDGSVADFGLLEEPTPHPSDWYSRWKALPEGERNVLRTYTPAAIRVEERELDVDFFLHEPAGPASRWATEAEVGDRVVITGPDRRMGWTGYGLHWAPGDATRFLLVADETAFPAVRAILRTLDDARRVDVVLECSDAANDIVSEEARSLAAGEVVVVPRGDGDVTGAERAVAEWAERSGAEVREDPGFYAWVAGEAGTTARIRRYLTADVGISKDRVSFLGYWKVGGPLVG